jgi:Mg2+-importing ATPase
LVLATGNHTYFGVLLGGDIERMSDAALAAAVASHNVFAKLSPSHKERIVHLLKANGHVVGFMGDGINDAPALRSADIGISVDSAVNIAKKAADIILLEKGLMVLEEGVLEGRSTFANMLKWTCARGSPTCIASKPRLPGSSRAVAPPGARCGAP